MPAYNSGRSLFSAPVTPPPYTLPDVGEAVVIGTNYPDDIRPSGWTAQNWRRSLFDSYGGGVYVPAYSQYGAYVLAGTGGHNHPDHVGAALFDLSTGKWARLDIANSGTFNSNGDPYEEADTNGSPTFEITGTEVPAPPHPYQFAAYLPEGDKGSFLYVQRAATVVESRTSSYAHRLDLATRLWSRYSVDGDPSGGVGTSSGACYDAARGRYWVMASAVHTNNPMRYLDIATQEWEAMSNHSANPSSGYAGNARLLLHDTYLLRTNAGGASNTGLLLYDPDDPTAGWTALTVSGTVPPIHLSAASAWARYSDGNWYHFNGGADSSTIQKIVPPANPKTGTWTISDVSLTGETLPESSGINSTTSAASTNHYTRFFYVPALDCLCWIPGDALQVYLLKPPL